jgi:hypothetical protein
MDTTFTTLLTSAGGAFLGKFVGPAAEHLGKAAWERAQAVGKNAAQLLAKVGREPQPVEPKVLVPLVQAAALETDPGLSEQWAALLANAADPEQRAKVLPGFVDILRQLTPTEARVVNYIYAGQPPFSTSLIRPTSITTGEIMAAVEIPPATVAMSVDNLLRLRLCEKRTGGLDSAGDATSLSMTYDVLPTIFGLEFFKACTPPTG